MKLFAFTLLFLTALAVATGSSSSSNKVSTSITTSTKATSSATKSNSSSNEITSTEAHSSKASTVNSSTNTTTSPSLKKITTFTTSSASYTSSNGTISMPTLTGSSSSSSYNVTFTPIVPTHLNPSIYIPHLKNGTVFISFGAALGTILIGLLAVGICLKVMASKVAKKDITMKATDDFNYSPMIFKGNDDPSYKPSNMSIYSMGSGSTLNVLGSQASMEHLCAPGGRSLRTAMMGTPSRSSLFISPTEMLTHFNGGNRAGVFSADNSPIDSPMTAYSGNYSTPMSEKVESQNHTRRAPSVYLDEMFDSDDSEGSLRSSEEYDFDAHEKV